MNKKDLEEKTDLVFSQTTEALKLLYTSLPPRTTENSIKKQASKRIA